jgi:large subunit ribosomal protein L9
MIKNIKMTEVILIENIPRLGRIGSIISVKPGFARNYLFLQNKAIISTKESLMRLKEIENQYLLQSEELNNKVIEYKNKLSSLELVITKRAHHTGKIYGSISNKDIVNLISETQLISLKENQISFQEKSIKKLGDYTIKVLFSNQAETTFTLKVIRLK